MEVYHLIKVLKINIIILFINIRIILKYIKNKIDNNIKRSFQKS